LIKFSIITVVKNNVFEIEKTINSLKNQKFQNFEHIIVDGNSKDGTSEIIKRKINSKIKYYKGTDSGIYDAINKGIKHSKGNYIGLLHSGDFFASSDVLTAINKVSKNNDIVIGNICYFNKKISILRYWKKSLLKLSLTNSYKIPHTGMFIKKEIFKEIGNYNTKYKISSDTDFILRLSKKNYRLFYVNKNLIFMKSGGISSSNKTLLKKVREDLTIYFEYFHIFFIAMYSLKIFSKVFDFIIFSKSKFFKNLNNNLKKNYKKL
jgi:glycosyltransferase